jgi:glutathione S-transferase
MIKLYGFTHGFGVVDPSPFVLKVDAYLRLANIKYESFPSVDNLKKAPKGKLPFIIDGETTTVADSEFIISYLQEKFQIKLDSNLSAEQKSTAYLIGKSLDENLYWCLVYSRWVKDDTWIHVKKAFFGSMPFPLKFIVPPIARKGVTSALQKQGLGRHSDEEIKIIADRTFQSLSDILGEKTYFFGDSPCTFDATAFGFLAQFISVSLNNEMNDLARNYSNLVDYCNHMNAEYYK